MKIPGRLFRLERARRGNPRLLPLDRRLASFRSPALGLCQFFPERETDGWRHSNLRCSGRHSRHSTTRPARLHFCWIAVFLPFLQALEPICEQEKDYGVFLLFRIFFQHLPNAYLSAGFPVHQPSRSDANRHTFIPRSWVLLLVWLTELLTELNPKSGYGIHF